MSSTEEEDTISDGQLSEKMFDGLTAWFSSSVSEKTKTLWVKNDGLVMSSIDKAMFVFSADAGCEDTSCLYKTEAYLDEHLAIFHSSYVDKCVEKGDIKKVALGKYFLPPLELQKEIHGFMWHDNTKTENKSRSEKENQKQNGERTLEPSEGRRIILDTASPPSHPQYPDYTHVDDLERIKGDLEEFVIGQNGCCVFKKEK